jgi:hypothetical protein
MGDLRVGHILFRGAHHVPGISHNLISAQKLGDDEDLFFSPSFTSTSYLSCTFCIHSSRARPTTPTPLHACEGFLVTASDQIRLESADEAEAITELGKEVALTTSTAEDRSTLVSRSAIFIEEDTGARKCIDLASASTAVRSARISFRTGMLIG